MPANESGERKAVLGENSYVTISLVGVLLGFAFWMGIQHNQLSDLNASVRDILKDHETRLRVLEKRQP